MSRIRYAIALFLADLAQAIVPDRPFFPPDEDGDRLTPEKWAALIVLHAEAVHGCEHTEQARRELGMVGPRGEAAP